VPEGRRRTRTLGMTIGGGAVVVVLGALVLGRNTERPVVPASAQPPAPTATPTATPTVTAAQSPERDLGALAASVVPAPPASAPPVSARPHAPAAPPPAASTAVPRKPSLDPDPWHR
jgi:hypothetical protein